MKAAAIYKQVPLGGIMAAGRAGRVKKKIKVVAYIFIE
jgi:hypothetical protein